MEQTQSRDPSAKCNKCGCQVRFHDPQVVQSRLRPFAGKATDIDAAGYTPPADTPWECYAYVNGGRCGCKAILNPLVTA